MNSFFRELKQRKVYRVALGYAVVAWLVIQISATVMPAYHAPEWILPIFITVIALGFPVALGPFHARTRAKDTAEAGRTCA